MLITMVEVKFVSANVYMKVIRSRLSLFLRMDLRLRPQRNL
jgi:hypothetical protein